MFIALFTSYKCPEWKPGENAGLVPIQVVGLTLGNDFFVAASFQFLFKAANTGLGPSQDLSDCFRQISWYTFTTSAGGWVCRREGASGRGPGSL